ncbi:AAA family ATPase [Armatimonas sp.]|uniref:ATP-binding protein n=1 Tax=Armatimonas sp. TaxID=1872638 RepID=UPI00286B78A4|nr:AAA family ATPase [Armatimonas sp.]
MYRIELCDGVSVHCGEAKITKFRTQKAARLLAYLALHPGSHSREKLVELFWPELELDAARNGLSYTLLYLRNPLEKELGQPEGSLIQATRTTICLVPGSFTTDLENLPKDFDVERLLPGLYDDWVLEVREKLGAMLAAAPNDHEPLPATWTPYLGRDDIREQVRELLNGSRLLTLLGTGGVGKTRLALETLRQREAEGSPVAWVELSTLTHPAQIAERIATALGLAGTAALVPVLRRRAILLCLDNCEHLIHGAAREAERLLRACPNLTILATSREPLGVAGETLLRLPGLSEAEAAQLFCDRARRAQPSWELTRTERPLLSLLCLRLDGLPLALELAAAKLRTYPLSELVQRLEDRLAMLTSNHRVAEPRQQTLEASIAWSYDLLSEREKALFYSLSVFHGGWTAEQAIGLWGGDETTRERLDALVDKSLAQTEATSHGLHYRFLETIREFAQARLSEQSEAEQLRWRRAHLEVFYDLLMTVPRRYDSEAAPRSEAIRPYQDNFLPALEFCRQDQPKRALIFCWHLSTFWDWFAQSTLAREQLKLTLPLPECQTLDDDRRIALDELYWACTYTRDLDGVVWALNTSDLSTTHPYQYQSYLATVKIEQGKFDEAKALLESSLEIAQKNGDSYMISAALRWFHYLALWQGDFVRAEECLKEAELYEPLSTLKDPGQYRIKFRSRVVFLLHKGESKEARELLPQCLQGDLSYHEVAFCLALYAHLAFLESRYQEGAQLYGTLAGWCERKGFDVRGLLYRAREGNLVALRERLGEEAFQVLYNESYDRDGREVLQTLEMV